MAPGRNCIQKKIISLYRATKRKVSCRPTVSFDHEILIGTHHKTGTVWLKKIFQRACGDFGLRFFSGQQGHRPYDLDVYFHGHSKFDLESLGKPYRGIHVIRDPRDRIVSGCFYHQKSDEPWLHEEKAEFGGSTYQQKINSFSSVEDKLLFEMENSGSNGIREMLEWNYKNHDFMEVKYEDLIRDYDLSQFHRIFSFLHVPGSAIPRFLEIAYDNSLFSGNVSKSMHVRSGTTAQWKQYFSPKLKSRFSELFPNALAALGYEPDDSWASGS